MKFGKSELIRRISDVVRNGWSNVHIRDLVESLWRDPFSMRTSGFVKEGGTDSMIAAEVTSTEIGGITDYAIVVTITPKGRKFDFYQFRDILTYHKKSKQENIGFDAEEGLHVVYYDFDDNTFEQVLKHIHNPSHEEMEEVMQWVVPVTFLYYDAEKHEITYFGNNRHGSWWNPWIHFVWHQTMNSQRETGLEFTDLIADGDGSDDRHAQFGVSKGSCFHEDIYATSEGAAAPASIPVWYFKTGNKPRIHDDSVNSLVVDVLLCYNSAGAVVAATSGWFVMYHIFFTNDILEPFISVMGQAQYEKVSTATLMINSEIQQVKDMLPHQNMLHIGTLLFQTSTTFTNSYKSRLVKQAWGVITRWSVTGDGSAATPVQLKNDSENPGNNKFYGTDGNGVKGWVSMPVIDLIRDIGFDWNDVEAGTEQTWVITIMAAFDYLIESIVLESDDDMTGVEVRINGNPVIWVDGSSTKSSIDVANLGNQDIAHSNNLVHAGERVEVVSSGVDSGNCTLLRGEIRRRQVIL